MRRGAVRGGRRWPARLLPPLCALVVSLAVVAPAGAQSGLGAFGLSGLPTNLLPPNNANSTRTVYPGFDVCPGGEESCPAGVILEMYERWRPLNATCDHNAVFALTYLRTTEEFVRAAGPGFFEDGPWVNHEDTVFAELYFRAFDAYARGDSVPVSWTTAFDTAKTQDQTGLGDLFLGMNAHINRDLSYTLAALGLVKPDGGSRKTDHDRVNAFLQRVADPLQAELARRYDPLFGTTDTPTPLDEDTVVNVVRGFREQAWRNAENLVNASSNSLRALAASSIETQSEAYATSIRNANAIPGYGAVRDAHCRANLEPSFRVRMHSTRLRRVVKRRRVWLLVSTDGPARLTLSARLLPGGTRKPYGVIGKRAFRVEGAGTYRVKLRVGKRGRRMLRRRHRRAPITSYVSPPKLSAPGLAAKDTGALRAKRRHKRRR